MSGSRPFSVATAAGLVLRGEEWPAPGARGGPVILLPGGGQTRHSWKSAAAALQRAGRTAVTVDLRGHGDSDWDPGGDYSVAAIAADTRVVLHAFGEQGRSVLVGNSLGGMASLVAAARHPGLCRAVVLVDIALRVEARGSSRIKAFMSEQPDGYPSLEEAAAAVVAYRGSRTRPPNLENLARNLRRTDEGRWRWHWDPRLLDEENDSEDPCHPVRVELRRSAATVGVPVLLVRGLRSDVVSEESVAEATRLLAGMRVAEVDAGHMVAGDDNDSFLAAILEFLDDLDREGGPIASGRSDDAAVA